MAKESIVLERCFVPKGKLVVKEGDEGNCAYLIQSGSVSVFTYNDGNKIDLAKFSVGEIFGELSLIFDEPRSASVMADQDCNLIVITRQTLKQKLKNSDPMVSAIVGMLTKRILSVNNALVTKLSDVDDLIDTSRIIYQNVLTSMPRSKQRSFQNAVLPKLDDLLDTIREFQLSDKDE
ncbi:MAG: cyclic nucleotide-binding domain-containing protein [Alphaproteobacteria bacterium]|nr:cyclic nucleotide-binding domain-containing protein [Alphaproteobacteria bacterium]